MTVTCSVSNKHILRKGQKVLKPEQQNFRELKI